MAHRCPLTPSLHPDLVQEGRLQVEELGHDVEREEVAVSAAAAHGGLQQGLVLVRRQAEQGEALRVLGPGRSQVMEKQEVGLLWVCHTPASAQLATPLQGRDSGSVGQSLARGTPQGRICLTLPKPLPLNHLGSGERERRRLGPSEQRL